MAFSRYRNDLFKMNGKIRFVSSPPPSSKMATTTTEIAAAIKVNDPSRGKLIVHGQTHPLKPTGALDKFTHSEVTPVIGRLYPTIQLSDLLKAENSDELIRELAIIGK